ncbi:MAG: hypothetical protein KJO21_04065 [Verrucomicrobiae bacterium]|nr:hypothetical protein [Verrucomicrobiae bacterium]NNJ42675.1 hypothetical protein [Akkermansiaceae bacterium]
MSWTLTKSSLVAVLMGMVTYTAFEITTSGKLDPNELFIHHLLPTLFTGIIIWFVLSFLLRSKVINPVREILVHLTHIGNGRFAPLEIDSDIYEIEEIVDEVNHLTFKLKEAPDAEGTSKAIDDLVMLRADIKNLIENEQLAPDPFIPIMKDLKKLESHLLSAILAEPKY